MPVFLAPWFLLAGVAASVPVALHLLHRRRPKPVPFSALRFLHEAVARTRRSRHLTNFLTLLMRVLLILLLACAFSRPKVKFATWLPEGRRTVVLILDGSASMHCRDGELTCFARARDWALDLVRSLDEDDQVALLIPGLPEPRLVFPPISDHDAIVRALEETEPGYGRADVVEVLHDLLSRLPEGRGSYGTEVHLFSDYQTSSWNTSEVAGLTSQLVERELMLFLNQVSPAVAANAGVARAAFYPPAILGDGQFEARTRIRSSTDYEGANSMRLVTGGEEQSRCAFKLLPDQTIAQGLEGSATGDEPFVLGQLELDSDGFALDNIFRFCLPRLPGIPVLLVDGSAKQDTGSRDTAFLRYAIQPLGKARTLFLPKTVDWATFMAGQMREFGVIFVCNPPRLDAAAVNRLQEHARNGGTVVLMPGQHNALETGLRQLPPLKGMNARKQILPQEKPMAVVPSETPSELEKKLLGVMPPPSALVIRRRLVFSRLPADARMVFQYHDGGAFMFELPFGQGSFWVASVSANRDWSEWPLTPFFVVMNQELIKSSARRSLTVLTTTVGGTLPLDWPEQGTEFDFSVRAPSGKDRTVNLRRADNNKPLVLSHFEEPGFYQLRREDSERRIAVNIAPEEGDLRYLAGEELSMPFQGAKVHHAESWHKQQQHLVNLHHGRPLWPLLLCGAFFLAVIEELFANVRSRASGIPEALRQFIRRGGRAA